MATGPVSSRHNLGAAPEAQPVIRVGEVQSSVADLKDPNTKIYHHVIPGAGFVLPDGLRIQFLGGVFATNDPAVQRELDAVANKTASMIYTKQEVVGAVTAMQAQAAADAAETAGTIKD